MRPGPDAEFGASATDEAPSLQVRDSHVRDREGVGTAYRNPALAAALLLSEGSDDGDVHRHDSVWR
jgi:hypothetical protein